MAPPTEPCQSLLMESPNPTPQDEDALTNAMSALQCRTPPVSPTAVEAVREPKRRESSTSHSNRRALLAFGLFVLALAGIMQLATATPETRSGPGDGSRANVVFSNALSGTCLNWPVDSPDKPSFVQCTDDHMFEVARPVGMDNFMEPCQLAVRDYLGPHFDPNSKFTSSVLWAGDAQAAKTDERNLLCGLQLPDSDGRPIAFKGMVAEQDQSKVWPAGTCLGIDTENGHSTEKVVQCSAPHAVEVTGTINLADQFPNSRPPEPEQDGFVRDACTRATDGYLAPVPLNATGLSVNYALVSSASWAAGSRQVPCTIGIRRGDASWVALVGSAKEGVLIDGQTAPPPPETVETPSTELPPTPLDETPTVETTSAPVATTVTTPATSPTPTVSTTTGTTTGPPPPPPPPTEPATTEPPANVVTIGGIPFTLPFPAPPTEPPPPPGSPPGPPPA